MKNETIENLLNLDKIDSSILNTLTLDELEELSDNLSKYKKHLTETQGA